MGGVKPPGRGVVNGSRHVWSAAAPDNDSCIQV